jgi:hypothetical protein
MDHEGEEDFVDGVEGTMKYKKRDIYRLSKAKCDAYVKWV